MGGTQVGETHTCVGLANAIYIRYIYGILAGKLPIIRSYTVYIHGTGQPYTCDTGAKDRRYVAPYLLQISAWVFALRVADENREHNKT
jgi:hypothetical protein